MKDSIGSSIKGISRILFVICVIVSIIAGLLFWRIGGLLFLVGGVLLSGIACIFMYGFGELIENSHQQVIILTKIHNEIKKESCSDESPATLDADKLKDIAEKTPQGWLCSCGVYNNSKNSECSVCFKKRPK